MPLHDLEPEDVTLLASLVVASVAVIVDDLYESTPFKVLKIAGLFLSIGLAVHRIRTSRPFYCDISVDDWARIGKWYQFVVEKRQHKRGKTPQTRCLVPNGHGGFGGCFVEGDVQPDGSIIVRVEQPTLVRLEVRK